jgi:hypothetical protein
MGAASFEATSFKAASFEAGFFDAASFEAASFEAAFCETAFFEAAFFEDRIPYEFLFTKPSLFHFFSICKGGPPSGSHAINKKPHKGNH